MHTKEPWRASVVGSTETLITSDMPDFSILVRTGNGDGWGKRDFNRADEHRDNVNLVIAAPIMFAALLHLRDHWEGNLSESMRLVNEAIALTGQQEGTGRFNLVAVSELVEAARHVLEDADDRGETRDETSGEEYEDWKGLRSALNAVEMR